MTKQILLFLFSIVCFNIQAQIQISGVVNTYGKVLSVDTCKNSLNLDSSIGFNKDDEVILIQMKSAIMNESQSSQFGNLINSKSAGLYEINQIDSVYINTIYIRNKFVNFYYPDGTLQLVRIPKYQNAIVTDTLKPKAWDGATGGVLAINVIDELILNAPIDATGKGFRGGKGNPNQDPNNACTWILTVSDYWVNASSWRGALKGEGIAATINGKEGGRGAQVNGGGGGDDHNAGGGGGSNIASGGNGGENIATGVFDCKGPNPGIGGKALNGTLNRIYLGGGGGAGHGNNGLASSGGTGGGIVFIFGKKITATGTKIITNGTDSKDTFGDGAGGGGAGGTVVLDVDEVNGNLTVQAKGGKGASIINTGDSHCFGPGGGGSGGRVITSTTLTLISDLKGGTSGLSLNPSCGNSPNNAQKGSDGLQELNQFLPYAKQKVVAANIATQPKSDSICLGKASSFSVQANGVGLSYQWQINTGSGFQNLNDGVNYSGTKTNVLTLNNPTNANNNNLLKCIITSICGDKLETNSVLVNIKEKPKADFTFVKSGGFYTFKNTSLYGSTYKWDFGDGTNSTLTNPQHLYTQDGDFLIELVAFGECGVSILQQTISIVTPPTANFKSDTLTACAPFTITYKNTSSANSTQYLWTFEGANILNSTLKEPSVTYLKPGIYGVTLEASNSQFKDTKAKPSFILIQDKPTASFSIKKQLNTSIEFTNTSTNASTYTWDFGDGITDFAEDGSHIYFDDGEYTVKLTATNICGSVTTEQKVQMVSAPKAKISTDIKSGCAPLTVQFNDLTPQNLAFRKWYFQGAQIDTSSQKSPKVTYAKAGTYEVKLWVSNSSGKDSILSKNYIKVYDKPSVSFEVLTNKLGITAQNNSADAISYLWTISADNGAVPTQTFTTKDLAAITLKSGNYTIKLEATNDCGTVSATKNFTIKNELVCDQIEMKVTPNPADYHCMVQFNAARTVDMPYMWTTSDGRILQQGTFEKNSLIKDFNTEEFIAGIYILYSTCEEKIFVQKIMIAHGE